MRILIADDGTLFRAGLVSLVRARGHAVVGQARDGFEALEQARLLRPDIILMDVEMPHCSGVEATRLIKAELPETKVILLTDSPETGALIEAVSRGIDGYVLKEMPEDQLAYAIEALVEKGCSLSSRPPSPPPREASGVVSQEDVPFVVELRDGGPNAAQAAAYCFTDRKHEAVTSHSTNTAASGANYRLPADVALPHVERDVR